MNSVEESGCVGEKGRVKYLALMGALMKGLERGGFGYGAGAAAASSSITCAQTCGGCAPLTTYWLAMIKQGTPETPLWRA